VTVEVETPQNLHRRRTTRAAEISAGKVVRNAVRYTGENTAVTVRLEPIDDQWRILVRTYGPRGPAISSQAGFSSHSYVYRKTARDARLRRLRLGLSHRTERALRRTAAAGSAANDLAQGGLCVDIRLPAGVA